MPSTLQLPIYRALDELLRTSDVLVAVIAPTDQAGGFIDASRHRRPLPERRRRVAAPPGARPLALPRAGRARGGPAYGGRGGGPGPGRGQGGRGGAAPERRRAVRGRPPGHRGGRRRLHAGPFAAHADQYQPKMRALVEERMEASGVDYVEAEQHCRRFRADMATLLADPGAHDLIIAATASATGRTVVTADATAFQNLPGVDFDTAADGWWRDVYVALGGVLRTHAIRSTRHR